MGKFKLIQGFSLKDRFWRIAKSTVINILFIMHFFQSRAVILGKKISFLFNHYPVAFLFVIIVIFSFTQTPFNKVDGKVYGGESLLEKTLSAEQFGSQKSTSGSSLLTLNQAQKKNLQIALADGNGLPSQISDEGCLVTPQTQLEPDYPLTRTETQIYKVELGDTLYSIADKFNLKIDSLLWSNNLSLRSILRPGQELKVLPVDGLTHKVKKGEALEQIAKKYKSTVDEIVEYNDLADNTDIYPGDELIIPFGQQVTVPAPKPVTKPKTSTYVYQAPAGNNCHKFVPGQCTWYVASRRCIPWTGHAKDWLSNAKKFGFAIGHTPQVGAAVSLRESGWAARRYGHIAYVESVSADTITISEMNFKGPWIKSTRVLNIDSPNILGYIY